MGGDEEEEQGGRGVVAPINKLLPLQGKILATSKTGFFPSDAVRPCPCVSERPHSHPFTAITDH